MICIYIITFLKDSTNIVHNRQDGSLDADCCFATLIGSRNWQCTKIGNNVVNASKAFVHFIFFYVLKQLFQIVLCARISDENT